MNAHNGFVTQQGLDLQEQLAFAAEEGFDYVEILVDGEHRVDRLDAQRERITDALEAGGLDLVVHLPFPTDIGSPYEEIQHGAVETQKRCIETAVDLGAEKGVLHPESSAWEGAWDPEELRPHVDDAVQELVEFGAEKGVLHPESSAWEGAWDPEELRPHVDDAVQELVEFGAEDGFEICAENIFGNVYTVETINGLLAETDASMTLDTGHARITGFDSAATASFVETHADRISHVHLNDTRGPSDEHLPFGAGSIDFEVIFDAFPSDWTGTLSLEVATESYDYLRQSKAVLDELQ